MHHRQGLLLADAVHQLRQFLSSLVIIRGQPLLACVVIGYEVDIELAHIIRYSCWTGHIRYDNLGDNNNDDDNDDNNKNKTLTAQTMMISKETY